MRSWMIPVGVGVVIGVLICLLSLPAPAHAAPKMPCAKSDKMAELILKHDEVPLHYGFLHNGLLIQVWISKVGTWTLTTTTPSGMSCIVAVGSDWQTLPTPPTGPLA